MELSWIPLFNLKRFGDYFDQMQAELKRKTKLNWAENLIRWNHVMNVHSDMSSGQRSDSLNDEK